MSEDSHESQSWAPLFWVAALSFLVLLSYGIARSATDSLLLQDHGKGSLAYAYGAVAICVTFVVALYAKAAARFSIGHLFVLCSLLSALALVLLLLARQAGVPGAAFGLYIWKDVYIVLLVELVWTLANSAFKQSTATWAYGFFCVAGTFGDMSGSYLLKEFVLKVGTASMLWFVTPVLIAVAIVGRHAARRCGWPVPDPKNALTGLWAVVRRSRPIQILLVLIAIIQIATTLIDYSYRTTAFDAFPDLDSRAAMFGQVDIAIGQLSMALQLSSGLISTILGVRLLIIILPMIVGAAALYWAIHPTFAGIAVLKVVNKGIDYSLFRTSKELLYRPLSYGEKTQGKAAVDIFGYRVAKGGATGLLVLFSGATSLVAMAIATGIGLWLLLAIAMATRFTHRTEK